MDKAQPMQGCSIASWLLVCHGRSHQSHNECSARQGRKFSSAPDAASKAPHALSVVFRASMVPGLTDSNASLAAENTRLNDRMAKLVKDLTEENTHLLSENQRLNETMQKVLFLLNACYLAAK